VFLDVAGVSRHHAQITIHDNVASLEDLGSKNGTLVEDVPIRQRTALRDGDRIQLATELLVFRTSDKGVPTVTHPMPLPGSRKDRAT
jgi:pSer/pThr/pTyr-binding forkhead associated (FHA) protein